MNKPKVVCIVGARPQFIKYGPLDKKLKQNFDEVLVHTGQHYDKNLSQLIFEDLNISKPDFNLNIGSSSHGVQTGKMLIEIENILIKVKPHWVIVFGDTNSTIAGALAAAKLNIKVAHIEAGLRSFNPFMPEEINRILTDKCSSLLLCPTMTAIKNLEKENLSEKAIFSGDIMYEAFLNNKLIASKTSHLLSKLRLKKNDFLIATVHRAENTDNLNRLKNIICAFNKLDQKIVFSLHPRTKHILENTGIIFNDNVIVTKPIGYLDMLDLLVNSSLVLTDSGGLQKEAYFAKKPCITLRDETEWTETLLNGTNKLVGADTELILNEVNHFKHCNNLIFENHFGDGKASDLMIELIKEHS